MIRLVEIRNLRVNQRLSEETLCFSASVYVDGKKVGEATNHGHGGNTDVHIPRELVEPLKEYAVRYFQERGDEDDKRLLFEPSPSGYMPDLVEYLIDHLVDEEERQKESRRIAKIEDKQRANFAARGLPYMLRVSMHDAITWYGLPDNKPETVEACVGKAKAKYRVITGHEVLSTDAPTPPLWDMATDAHVEHVLATVDADPACLAKPMAVGPLGPMAYHFIHAERAKLIATRGGKTTLTQKGRETLAALKARS